jgi:hypothetical protein
MIYAILIIPHMIALSALFMYAYRTDSAVKGAEPDVRSEGPGGPPPPEPPSPVPSGGGLPLPNSTPPRRRLQDGERLSDLHLHPRRRESEPPAGDPVPAPPVPTTV